MPRETPRIVTLKRVIEGAILKEPLIVAVVRKAIVDAAYQVLNSIGNPYVCPSASLNEREKFLIPGRAGRAIVQVSPEFDEDEVSEEIDGALKRILREMTKDDLPDLLRRHDRSLFTIEIPNFNSEKQLLLTLSRIESTSDDNSDVLGILSSTRSSEWMNTKYVRWDLDGYGEIYPVGLDIDEYGRNEPFHLLAIPEASEGKYLTAIISEARERLREIEQRSARKRRA